MPNRKSVTKISNKTSRAIHPNPQSKKNVHQNFKIEAHHPQKHRIEKLPKILKPSQKISTHKDNIHHPKKTPELKNLTFL